MLSKRCLAYFLQKKYQQLFTIQKCLILSLMESCIFKPLTICLKLLLLLKIAQILGTNQGETGGLASILAIKINARVMLTVIVD